jgi:CBS domain-containing protein
MTPVSEYAIVSPYTRVSDAAGYAEHIGIDQLVVATDDAVVGLVCRCQLLDRSDIELVAERMRTELGRVEVDATPEETAAAIEDGGETLCVVAGDVLVGLIDRRALRGAPARPRCDTCGSCPVDLQ